MTPIMIPTTMSTHDSGMYLRERATQLHAAQAVRYCVFSTFIWMLRCLQDLVWAAATLAELALTEIQTNVNKR